MIRPRTEAWPLLGSDAPVSASAGPRLPDPLPPGAAELRVGASAGATTILSARATAPMRLLTPRCRGAAAWVYACSFGGGILAGDRLSWQVALEADAALFTSTQATTKVYKSPAADGGCTQRFAADLAPGSLLVSWPDPVSCFADSSFSQSQTFRCRGDASLVALDACTAGRSARGERWRARRLCSELRVDVDGRPWFLDRCQLDHRAGLRPLAERMGGMDYIAVLVLRGPACSGLVADLQAGFRERPAGPEAGVLQSFQALPGGGVLRLAAPGVAAGNERLLELLDRFAPAMGGAPWRRRP